MLAYGGDSYSGYAPQYEDGGEGWAANGESWGSWGGQTWGTQAYDQVSYDCNNWDYTPQTWGQSAQSLGESQQAQEPKVGAELLTELRLAELKRLIDRDAKAPPPPFGGPAAGARQRRVPQLAASHDVERGERGERGERRVSDSERSAECTTRAPDSNEDTPKKLAHLAAVARPGDGAGEAEPRSPAEVVELERYVVLADFEPHTREHGEMSVRLGEEVFVRGGEQRGWIFGIKRTTEFDQGWLPAEALGIDCASNDSDAEGGIEEPRQARRSGRAEGADDRNASEQRSAPSASGGSRGCRGGKKAAKRTQDGDVHDDDDAELWQEKQRSGLESRKEQRESHDSEAWHHHGNWWSKQRHLRSGKEPPPREEQRPQPRRGKGGGSGGQRGGSGACGALVDEWTDHSSWAASAAPATASSRSAAKERGSAKNSSAAAVASTKGSGKGGAALPERVPRGERVPRERPALTSLLDRLNKPLVAPPTSK